MLVGKDLEKRSLERLKSSWEDNNVIGPRKVECEVDHIRLCPWKDLVLTA
jgi:hypothetical protein